MTKFTYNDTVKAKDIAPKSMRPGQPASVVGISCPEDRFGSFLEEFPESIVYTIEFEGGDSIDVPEYLLEKGAFPSEMI